MRFTSFFFFFFPWMIPRCCNIIQFLNLLGFIFILILLLLYTMLS